MKTSCENRVYEVPRMSVIRLETEDVITLSHIDNWEISYEDEF